MSSDETPLEPSFPVRRLPPPGVLAAITGLLGLVLFATFGFASQTLNIPFGLWFTEIFIFLGVPWVLVRFSGRDPASYLGMRAPRWQPIAFGFALGVVNFFALVVPLQFASQSVAPQWLRELTDASQIFRHQTPLELALLVGALGIAAPVCEESFFRGVLQRGLMPPTLRRPALAVIFTAVVFSAFHLDPVGFLARVELGALFGYLYLRTNSIWPGAAAHAANNLVSTALYFGFKDAAESKEPEPEALQILLLAAFGLAVLGSLFSLPRRYPSLLSERPFDEGQQAGPFRSLARLALPWVAAALASLALLAGVDSRGVALNYWEARYRLPPLKEDAPAELKKERDELEQLRARARRGEVPIDEYANRLKLLAKETGTSSPSAPVPPSPP